MSVRLQRWLSIAGGAALLALIGLYCVPTHPHAASGSSMDALAHVLAFGGVGFALGWAATRRTPLLAGLALIALALEVLQRNVGGYVDIEWHDVIANEGGVLAAWLVLGRLDWRRNAVAQPAGD